MSIILAGLTVVGILVRLLPHPANFTPIAALALFSGAYFSKRWSWIFPLFAMLVSDSMIGFYDVRLMAAVYGSLLLPILISRFISPPSCGVSDRTGRIFTAPIHPRGRAIGYSGKMWGFIQKNKNVISITAVSLAGSVLFFLITNFAVWAYSSMYTRDLAGLAQSYIAGLPFFRNTVLGDLFWAGVFFGGYAFALKLAGHPRAQLSATPLNQKT